MGSSGVPATSGKPAKPKKMTAAMKAASKGTPGLSSMPDPDYPEPKIANHEGTNARRIDFMYSSESQTRDFL